VTIQPFDDGNGRIARAIADLCLARPEQSPQRFYSMSAQIRQERKEYYDLLEHTQKGETDITEWLTWFLECLSRAIDGAETLLASVLTKARFWQSIGASPPERPGADPQKSVGWSRWQTHLVEMGKADEIIAGHRAARCHGPRSAWNLTNTAKRDSSSFVCKLARFSATLCEVFTTV
jgi:hypothetical protein